MTDFPRSDPALLNELSRHSAAVIGDAMDRFGILDARIRSTWAGARITGSAFTVWTRSGDNMAIHAALELTRPGDVLVVNGFGEENRALIGEMIGIKAKTRGLAGFILDGAARDIRELAELDMPVFARSVTAAGPYKFGPYKLALPIACGGVCVHPGDAVLADGDGVAIVPRTELEATLRGADAIVENEKIKRVDNAVPLR